ncbi:MAG TPA: hypothetical protein VN538_00055, partial [Clostridia bacterium]|nr:hypothetical protein [Clostridia bacterium]
MSLIGTSALAATQANPERIPLRNVAGVLVMHVSAAVAHGIVSRGWGDGVGRATLRFVRLRDGAAEDLARIVGERRQRGATLDCVLLEDFFSVCPGGVEV